MVGEIISLLYSRDRRAQDKLPILKDLLSNPKTSKAAKAALIAHRKEEDTNRFSREVHKPDSVRKTIQTF